MALGVAQLGAPDVAAHRGQAPMPAVAHDLLVGHVGAVGRRHEAGPQQNSCGDTGSSREPLMPASRARLSTIRRTASPFSAAARRVPCRVTARNTAHARCRRPSATPEALGRGRCPPPCRAGCRCVLPPLRRRSWIAGSAAPGCVSSGQVTTSLLISSAASARARLGVLPWVRPMPRSTSRMDGLPVSTRWPACRLARAMAATYRSSVARA